MKLEPRQSDWNSVAPIHSLAPSQRLFSFAACLECVGTAHRNSSVKNL